LNKDVSRALPCVGIKIPCLAVTRQGKSNIGSVSTMLDYQEYTTQIDHYQGNGNGYDHLQGDWALFYKVAKGFIRRVKLEDRQDFLHDLLITMYKVKVKYQAIGKELTEAGLIRVACYDVADYWRKKFRRMNGHDCGRCSQEQRHTCKDKDLYRECPKAIKIESLDTVITDGDGNQIELYPADILWPINRWEIMDRVRVLTPLKNITAISCLNSSS